MPQLPPCTFKLATLPLRSIGARRATPPDGVFCFACGTKLNSSGHAEKRAGPTIQRKAERRAEAPAEVAPEVAPKPEARRKRHGAEKYAPTNGLAVKKCPKCGMENLSLAAYCYECNTALSGISGNAASK